MEKRRRAAEEILARRRARRSMLDYARYMMPTFVVGEHHRRICDLLERVERGETKRVIITAPPRHGKSQLVSRMFPAWFLGRNPASQVIISSYGQELASDFGRDLRNAIGTREYRNVFPSVELDDASKAANRFHTKQGGVLYAVGAGGALTGRGFNCGIIDDPLKGREDADSAQVRRQLWNWYTSTFYTRAMPDAALILMQTRWHEDDLAGRLLDAMDRGGEEWEVLELPAIADEGTDNESALWPEWYPVEALSRIRASIGPRDWSALYQQRPQSEDGAYFKREWFSRYTRGNEPENMSIYITSDFAVTEGAGDYTVHTVWGVDSLQELWCLAVWRGKTTPDAWVDALLQLAARYKPLCFYGESGVIRRAIEPMLVQRQRAQGVYFRTEWLSPVKDKATRARGFQSRAAMGLVHMPDTHWAEPLVDELAAFPAGKHDDFVDTCSVIGAALDRLTSRPPLQDAPSYDTRADYGFGSGSGVDFWRVC